MKKSFINPSIKMAAPAVVAAGLLGAATAQAQKAVTAAPSY